MDRSQIDPTIHESARPVELDTGRVRHCTVWDEQCASNFTVVYREDFEVDAAHWDAECSSTYVLGAPFARLVTTLSTSSRWTVIQHFV